MDVEVSFSFKNSEKLHSSTAWPTIFHSSIIKETLLSSKYHFLIFWIKKYFKTFLFLTLSLFIRKKCDFWIYSPWITPLIKETKSYFMCPIEWRDREERNCFFPLFFFYNLLRIQMIIFYFLWTPLLASSAMYIYIFFQEKKNRSRAKNL